ncbi:unnamed protein product [Paramecium sonneborni]|uniref:Transmembrane protein n=1 Tax=Paramecium sonneborni TaxID=65129 RepID=A0A8S1RWE3_9CILI|nr:unnamed protein product [Paramecium sonneborni]
MCIFFNDEHLKRHQTLKIAQTKQSEMIKNQAKPSSPLLIQEKQSSDDSQKDSEQLKTSTERIYQDRYSKYIEKFSSFSYEEFRYRKKNDKVVQKQQIFIVELVVNEQQLLITEIGYRRQLRDTIQQIYQSYQQNNNFQNNKLMKKIQQSFQDQEIINYQFPSHPSYFIDDAYQLDNKEVLITDQIYSPKQDDKGDLFLLSKIQIEQNFFRKQQQKQQRHKQEKLSFNIIIQLFNKTLQANSLSVILNFEFLNQASPILCSKKQQEFYNENESKLPYESKYSQQQIFEEYQIKQTQNLKLFETQYNLFQQQLNLINNPYSYRLQKYLFSDTYILIVCYIILISISTQGQFDFNNCLDLIELMITINFICINYTQHGYLKQFYNNQSFGQLHDLINMQNQYAIEINQAAQNFEQFYDVENKIQKITSLQEVIQLSLEQYYKLNHNNSNDSFIVDFSLTFVLVANIKAVGQLPQKAYDSCIQENLNDQKHIQLFQQYIWLLHSLQQRNHRTLYKEIIKLEPHEVNDEIEIYNAVVNILKKSIYEWMLIDFVQETQMFEINQHRRSVTHNLGIQKVNNSDTGMVSNSNKKSKNKLMEKLKKSKMNQNKYIAILMVGLLVILAYFLIVFLIIFILSQDIIFNIDAIFQSKLAQSSIINLINNVDLIAHSTLQSNTYQNIMNISQFQMYSAVLSDNTTDIFFEKYKNQLLSTFVDQSLQNNFNFLNEENICKQEIGIDCSLTDAIQLNPEMIPHYEQGMKSLLTQISTIIAQYPQFFDTHAVANNKQTLIDFYNNQQHILYIDYGSEILIKAYQKLISIQKDLFNQLLDLYKRLLLIFTLSVGLFGLIIIFLLGKYLLKMQKDSIDTCLTALLLVSPKRYLSKQLGLIIQKKL